MKGTVAGALAALALLCIAPARGEDGWQFGPKIEYRNKKADFRVTLIGYGQLDFVSFVDWETGGLEDNHFDITRLRPGIDGEWGRLSFQLQGDFADTHEDHLKDGWADYRFAKWFRLRVGNQKVPGGREWTDVSARRTDFVKRSLLAENLSPSRDLGAVVHGELGKRLEYMAGVFTGDGRKRQGRSETTAAGRLVANLPAGFSVGGSYTQAEVEAEPEPAGVEPDPRGTQAVAYSGFEFFNRKFAQGTRRRIGADATWARGPVSVQGEFLRLSEERLGQGSNFEDLPAVIGRGWTVSATWLVTGEKKKGGIKPKHPVFRGGGAIELEARYDELRLDDEGPGGGFAGVGDRSRNLRPAGDKAFVGGISWWLRSEVRLMGNVAVERFEDPILAPEPGRRGNYVTILARLQLELP